MVFPETFAILFQVNLERIIEPHNTNKNIFYKENRKMEKRKRKQSQRTGYRQAKRNRNKSRRVACEERARHYAEVFLPD